VARNDSWTGTEDNFGRSWYILFEGYTVWAYLGKNLKNEPLAVIETLSPQYIWEDYLIKRRERQDTTGRKRDDSGFRVFPKIRNENGIYSISNAVREEQWLPRWNSALQKPGIEPAAKRQLEDLLGHYLPSDQPVRDSPSPESPQPALPSPSISS